MLLKLSDISNPFRPWDVAHRWSDLIVEVRIASLYLTLTIEKGILQTRRRRKSSSFSHITIHGPMQSSDCKITNNFYIVGCFSIAAILSASFEPRDYGTTQFMPPVQ